jgi:cell division protein ZapA
MNDRVRVRIFGREYEMDAGGLTPLEVQSLADFVDQKMREISEASAIVDTQKIAVLAAINIALDYLQLKENSGKIQSDDITPRLAKLQEILDQALHA